MKCSKCFSEIQQGSAFCVKCGNPVSDQSQVMYQQSQQQQLMYQQPPQQQQSMYQQPPHQQQSMHQQPPHQQQSMYQQPPQQQQSMYQQPPQQQQSMYQQSQQQPRSMYQQPPMQQMQYQQQMMSKKKSSMRGVIIAMTTVAIVLIVALVGVLMLALDKDNKSGNKEPATDVAGQIGGEGQTTGNTANGGGEDKTEIQHTIMIYMIGSDLESENGLASVDIQEMLAADYDENIRVVLQTGGASKWWTDGIDDGKVQRFEIKDGQLIELDNLGKLNMADVDTLSEFITFANDNYKSEKYTLVLWNHGGGVPVSYGIDEMFPNDMLSDAEIGVALKQADVQLESIVMDACNMCTLEVALAVKDYAKYLVAAESYTEGTGMCYSEWLDYMGKNEGASGSEYCELLVSDYMDSQEGRDSIVSMSCINLSKVEQVYEAYEEYIQSLMDDIEQGDYPAYAKIRSECGLYKGTDSVDIITLATNYNTDKSSALINAVVNAVGYTESDYLYGHGLAVYSPYEYAEMYSEARESMELLGYSDEILEFYDAYVSLYMAYQGSDYVDQYAGAWYDVAIVDSYSAGTVENGSYDLPTSVVDGQTVVSMSDEEWEVVSSVEAFLSVMLDENNLVILGQDYYYELDQYGNILMNIPNGWTTINGTVASYVCYDMYEDMETGEWMQQGAVMARCNGEEVMILVYYDNNNPSGVIAGYTYYNFTDDTYPSGEATIFQFEDDDVVELIHPVTNIETGEITYENVVEESYYASDLVVSFEALDVSEDSVMYWYTIYDIYGNTYETEAFIY